MTIRQIFLLGVAGWAGAIGAAANEIVDTAAVRDVASLEVTVVENWAPAKNDPGVRRKLVEITVCEWWPGQKVRIPVTLNAPAEGPPCENLLLANMGLAPKMSPRIDAVSAALLARGVGVIQVGMGTIDAMAPKGKLHLGMREWLLKTKEVRYTSRWIWGMSYMRALTAALAEEDVFKGAKVVATGGSKRGIASAFAGIHDERFTGIIPVVAPPIGRAGGGYVSGLTAKEVVEADREFRADLAAGRLGMDPAILTLLDERDERRSKSRISLGEALAAGWSRADVDRVVEEITGLSQVAAYREALDARGVEYFYCVGTNDNVSPGLLELGRAHPDFPAWIVPGGMHGGPKMGLAKQVPTLPGTKENLAAFCSQHFFGDRVWPATPVVSAVREGGEIRVKAVFGKGPQADESVLWWSFDRSPAGSLPFEHDKWESVAMKAGGEGVWRGRIALREGARAVDLVTEHRDEAGAMPVSLSGPYLRVELEQPSVGGPVEGRPNVLMIAVDDLRPQLGCYGAGAIHSPNIDRLAGRGVLFENASCMVPTCGASRASLMTSVRPTFRRFVTHRARADKEAPEAVTLNTHFKEQGYATVSNGKIFHYADDSAAGWDAPAWRPEGSGYQLEASLKAGRENPNPKKRGPPFEMAEAPEKDYRDWKTATKSIADMRALAKGEKPFFLACGFYKPHLPFCAPKKYWDLYPPETIVLPEHYAPPVGGPEAARHSFGELRAYAGIPKSGKVPKKTALGMIRGYYACVSFIDAQVGRLLDALEEEGLAENTIVLLWGDHGWQLGEHAAWCKHSCFETSMNVPLIVSAPGMVLGGRAAGLVEFIDVYPSLCELAGLPAPGHLEGESFVPLLKDPSAPGKEYAVGRFSKGDTIRTERYRYSEYREKDGEHLGRMLYDHKVDPGENRNESENPEYKAIVERLAKRLRGELAGRDGRYKTYKAIAK